MRFRPALALTCSVLAASLAAPAVAQTFITPRQAELAVPFGSAKGMLVVAGDQVVFLSQEPPDASIAISRSAIRNVVRANDVVTITTTRPLQDRSGSRDTFRFRITDAAELMAWYEAGPAPAATAAAPSAPVPGDVLASYQVRHDHRIGSCRGQLILTDTRLAFESIDEIDDSRQWALEDLKEVEQDGVYKLKVEPFIGNTYNFELIGQGMDSAQFRGLVERIGRARATR